MPIVEDVDIIEILVFIVFNRQFDVVFLFRPGKVKSAHLACEVECLATAIRYGVGPSIIWQVGDDAVATHLQRIWAGEVDGWKRGGMGTCDIDGEMTVIKSLPHFFCLYPFLFRLGQARCLRTGTRREKRYCQCHQCDDFCSCVFHLIVDSKKVDISYFDASLKASMIMVGR